MDDMDRQNQVTAESTTTGVDRSERTAAAVVTAARLLANPRRVRRA